VSPPPTPAVIAETPSNDLGVTAADEAAWQLTANCESGGNWSFQGSTYSGGIGFLNSTWDAYGGTQFASNAGLATEDQQIYIAKKIQPSAPDQNGTCSSW
jgi:hypothetical protein